MSRKHRRAVAWMLVVVMSLSPSLVYARTFESAASAAARAEKPKIDLSYVTPDSAAVVVAFPRHVLTAPEMEMLPVEVLSAAGMQKAGIDPLQIDQILAVVEPPKDGAIGAAVVVKTASPLEQEKLLPSLSAVYRRRPIGRQAVPPRGQSDDARRFPRRRPHGAGGNGRDGSQIGRQPCRPEGRSHKPHVRRGWPSRRTRWRFCASSRSGR